MSKGWIDSTISSKVKEFVDRKIGKFEQVFDPSPLAGALQVATVEILSLLSETSLDEEEVTYALLGSFTSNIRTFALDFPDNFCPQFYWQRYSKNSRSQGSESASGADFAFLIRLNDDRARVAIFQAKKMDAQGMVDITQISPHRETADQGELLPEPQILRLLRNAQYISGNANLDAMKWVYYAGYSDHGCSCSPLSDHITTLENSRTFNDEVTAKLRDKRASLEQSPATDSKSTTILPSDGKSSTPLNAKPITDRKDDGIQKNVEPLKPQQLARLLKDMAAKEWAKFPQKSIQCSESNVQLTHLLSAGASIGPEDQAPGWLELAEKDAISEFIKNAKNSIRLVQACINGGYDLENSSKTSPTPLSSKNNLVLDKCNEFSRDYRQAQDALSAEERTKSASQLNANSTHHSDDQGNQKIAGPTNKRRMV
ncbi:hypothetical protein FEO90_06310 [Stenotrophomonas maltophilia]|nr:hypothetical protein FEO90_06310 [Stenotrophomonas maltophilia]